MKAYYAEYKGKMERARGDGTERLVAQVRELFSQNSLNLVARHCHPAENKHELTEQEANIGLKKLAGLSREPRLFENVQDRCEEAVAHEHPVRCEGNE